MLPYHYIVLSLIVFFIGVLGVLTRKNIFILLMSVELMLNSANLALIAFSKMNADLVGNVFVVFMIAIAAAEVSVGLALVIAMYRLKEEINLDVFNKLRG
ncbi:MAG: NADH-quinone oxidoreductase subunit NuoK [Candidatus Omnitrophica bacterium]|nr:NADH-quinone oxidoreductase subunit NuoK [Candidatus Omnitrophota bacterium]